MQLTAQQVIALTEESLRTFLALSIPEGLYLDYKEGLSGTSEKETKREFLKDVTAFANAAGGHLLLGVKEPSENLSVGLATAMRKLSDELEDMPDKHSDAYLRLSLSIQSTFCLVPPTPPEPPPWNPDWQHVGVSLGGPPGPVDAFVSLLLRDLQALKDATARALELGKNDAGGQRVKTAQTFLARGVGQAFREHLTEAPMTTEDGTFEKVLRLCLKVGGEADVDDANNPRDLHTLVMKTLSDTKFTEP